MNVVCIYITHMMYRYGKNPCMINIGNYSHQLENIKKTCDNVSTYHQKKNMGFLEVMITFCFFKLIHFRWMERTDEVCTRTCTHISDSSILG